jgi:hypothetical protein
MFKKGVTTHSICIDLIANGKHRRKNIFQLEHYEGTIIGEENLCVYISEYNKKLFGASTHTDFSLVETYTHDIPQISLQENQILTSEFTEKEVLEAIMQMEKNKAPGLDGFPAEFYQTCWGELPLFQLNFGNIILFPKKENATQIQQYRPIYLLY